MIQLGDEDEEGVEDSPDTSEDECMGHNPVMTREDEGGENMHRSKEVNVIFLLLAGN